MIWGGAETMPTGRSANGAKEAQYGQGDTSRRRLGWVVSHLHDSKSEGPVWKEVSADRRGDEEVQADSQEKREDGSFMKWIPWPTNRPGTGQAGLGSARQRRARSTPTNVT